MASIGAALLVAACDVDTGPGADVDVRVGDRGACPIWQCGFNSADVFGGSLSALDLGGEADADGLAIAGVLPPAKAAASGYSRLGVDMDALFLADASGDMLIGSALIGTRIVLARDGVPELHLEVAAHAASERWTPAAPPIDRYTLVVHDLATDTRRNVCSGGLSDPMAQSAVILGGETYDPDRKRVEPDRPGWFTIACEGSALAKMAMFGYGPQTSATTAAQRQATLKMITADYCGDGRSYTRTGVEVRWQDAAGQIAVAGDAGAVEAVWTDAGALCLDEPRFAGTDVACELPSCDEFDLADGDWISYLPA